MKVSGERMNAFYQRVDELCVKKGLTHRALAEELGIDEVTLCRYLLGQRKLQLSAFMEMCRVLEVGHESLYKTYLFSRLEERVERYRTEHD